ADLSGVYVARADGTDLHRLTSPGVPGEFSPDDRRLVITRQEGLIVANVDGTGEHSVRAVKPVAYPWAGDTPDGDAIYAAASGSLRIINLTTGAEQLISVPGGNLTTPRLSPDGTAFVFTFDATAAPTTAIWIMNADGSGAHQLIDDPTVNEEFSDWLP